MQRAFVLALKLIYFACGVSTSGLFLPRATRVTADLGGAPQPTLSVFLARETLEGRVGEGGILHRILQTALVGCVCIERGVLQGIAHVSMGTGHRPGGADGISSISKAGKLESRDELIFQFCPKAGKYDVPAQSNQVGGVPSHLGKVNLFVLSRPSIDWMRPTLVGRAICFPQLTDSAVPLIQNHPHRHTQHNV